ncbi:probable QCR9 - ubiquinol--cytochrome-c reductase subunit 9 [Ustilago sp. UG-2017a]|uniref:Complex III subunit 9 n=1 Tax=Ustilago trichophora TaxID=86804 RepID=A0A5C3EIV2_9BASI|nr:probable QCR9 - ubiquinol--cytochrome-c reductase subunit 9 [Ustilago sp. UG-2017a]SPC66552.1 probable QCR9 - ubiquinol--cytochrome-c reductase subunit 9 [Ustilago sp. UG-2017b]SPO30533.1 probable QCR9 - ubiquinol--cytochrome-c reductase subunit 9 [Ustilago trichophora]
MSLAKSVYNTVFKRNSVYVGSIFFGAFAFGIGYDLATTAWWDSHNKGKQWKDIRGKYLEDSE